MDVTPQVINEVEFSMARRGYDPDQVDEFLEKVAVAVGELNDRLSDLRERVVTAERRANEAERRAAEQPERVAAAPAAAAAVSAAAEAELETLKRTLLLAQRTADAAVREAEDEARQIVLQAEAEARTAHESTRRRVLDEIAALESTRDTLRADVDALDRHVDVQRNRLQGAIADLQRILEEPSGELTAAAPALADEAEPYEKADPAPVRASFVADMTEAAEPPVSGRVVADDDDDEAWARFSSADDDLDEGLRTEPVLHLDRLERGAGDVGDDAYLSELRKAMLDDTGAPDAADLGFFDEPDDSRAARSRFGKRR